MAELTERLIRDGFQMNIQHIPSEEELRKWRKFCEEHDIKGWEGWFLPESYLYPKVLANIEPNDVILDIGAGNFALSLLMAKKARKVYAIEVNPLVVKRALEIIGLDLPRNLILICGNALEFPIPKDVNTLVILMRHFQHEIPEEWLLVPKIISNIGGTFAVWRGSKDG